MQLLITAALVLLFKGAGSYLGEIKRIGEKTGL